MFAIKQTRALGSPRLLLALNAAASVKACSIKQFVQVKIKPELSQKVQLVLGNVCYPVQVNPSILMLPWRHQHDRRNPSEAVEDLV